MERLIKATLFTSLLTLAGCQLVQPIFEAGFYTGIFLIALLIGLCVVAIARIRRRR